MPADATMRTAFVCQSALQKGRYMGDAISDAGDKLDDLDQAVRAALDRGDARLALEHLEPLVQLLQFHRSFPPSLPSSWPPPPAGKQQ